jgi:hypothetical protein
MVGDGGEEIQVLGDAEPLGRQSVDGLGRTGAFVEGGVGDGSEEVQV